MNKMTTMLDFLGMTDEEGQVDNKQVQKSMKMMAEQAAKMSQFEEPNMTLMQTPGPMTNMDAQFMNRAIADAPYMASVPMGQRPMSDAEMSVVQQIGSYAGPQTNADAAMMRQYAPQNMSMQQIMTMLKRAGY